MFTGPRPNRALSQYGYTLFPLSDIILADVYSQVNKKSEIFYRFAVEFDM